MSATFPHGDFLSPHFRTSARFLPGWMPYFFLHSIYFNKKQCKSNNPSTCTDSLLSASKNDVRKKHSNTSTTNQPFSSRRTLQKYSVRCPIYPFSSPYSFGLFYHGYIREVNKKATSPSVLLFSAMGKWLYSFISHSDAACPALCGWRQPEWAQKPPRSRR